MILAKGDRDRFWSAVTRRLVTAFPPGDLSPGEAENWNAAKDRESVGSSSVCLAHPPEFVSEQIGVPTARKTLICRRVQQILASVRLNGNERRAARHRREPAPPSSLNT